MISLYNALKESLLSDFDDLEASMDPIKEIERFIKANYRINGDLQISKEPNENGKYEVSCRSAEVKNKNITSLTNNLFEWGEVDGYFYCSYCKSLTSLEDAPKKVSGSFYCDNCISLTSLKGAPEKVGGDFNCYNCKSLTSLEGAPEKVGGDFNCYNCKSLTSLEGAPKEVGGHFYCYQCLSLTSLKGSPKKVSEDFDCSDCRSLKSLKGAPETVGGNFDCWSCGKTFRKNDVIKICDVKNKIYT